MKRILTISIILLVILSVFTACSGKKESGVTGTANTETAQSQSGGSGIDRSLVLGSNEAWVHEYDNGSSTGYIFSSDGTYTTITKRGEYDWGVSENGKWSIGGGKLYLAPYETPWDHDYSVTGDNLTIHHSSTQIVTYQKTSGVVY